MAVPKRKMSRSNTRHRRSQWKAVAPTLVTCANPACGAKHLPAPCVRRVRPVRRPRRPSSGPLTEPRSADRLRRAPRRRSGIRVLDPELLERALTHRSFAYENGGLPTNERLEFLGDSVLGVVVTETLYRTHPDLSEGRLAKLRAAVVNARALAEVGRGIGARRARQARPRRGVHRRPQQGLDPVRHRRGGDRRGLPQRRLRGLRRGRAPALRPADRGRLRHGRRPGLEDLPAGALRRARPRRARVRHRGRRPRPREDLHRPGPRRRRRSTATASAAPRRRPSRRPPRRPTARSPPTSASRTPPSTPRAAPQPDRPQPTPCPSCPRSRSSAPASSATSLGAHDRPRRGPAPASGAPRPARPGRLRRRAGRAPDRGGPPPRQVPLARRSTTATRCSATSG